MLSVFAGEAAAFSCYVSGDGKYPVQKTAYEAITRGCQKLAGVYTGGTSRVVCLNNPPGNSFTLAIENTFGHSEYVSQSHCTHHMMATYHGCRYGGIRATGIVEATFDLNNGRCEDASLADGWLADG